MENEIKNLMNEITKIGKKRKLKITKIDVA